MEPSFDWQHLRWVSVLLFLQSENLISKSLWTNVYTSKLYPQCISHNPPGAKVMSYGGRSNNSEWHLVILLAQLGGLFVSHFHNFHIQDIPASLLTLQHHSSCSFSASELKTRKPGGKSGIWIMESSAGWPQVRAFLISGFVLTK